MELLRDLIETKTDHVPIMEALYALDVIIERELNDVSKHVTVSRHGAFLLDKKSNEKPGREVLFTHEGQKYLGSVTNKSKNKDKALMMRAKRLHENKRGGMIRKGIGKMGKFMNANPAMVIGAAALAVNAYGKYKRNKRNTITLHAKDAYERKMMTSVVDALTKGNKFRVVRTMFKQGGKSWILKRVGV